MTDQPNPGPSPDERAPATAWTPPSEPDVVYGSAPVEPPTPTPTPPYEPAEPGAIAPAQSVARDEATVETQPVSRRRSSGVRWAIALAGVALVVGATAAILALAAGRPSPSIFLGYMPTDTVSYGEYRLDLPGDQRAKMAAFLSKFPGFADQASAQTKLYEVFDRIVAAATENSQTYTTDIEPWFGGQIAMGSGPPSSGGLGGVMTGLNSGIPLFVVSVKDQAKATEWIKATADGSLTETAYNGSTIYSPSEQGAEGGFGIIVTGEVMLLGTEDAVKAAFDSNGAGALANDPEFKAAFATVSRDYVIFSYTEYRSLIQSLISTVGAGSGLESTTIDDELLPLVPAWQASTFRFENDSIVGDTAYPSIDIGYEATNEKSSLIGYAPAGTIFYAESHDIGASLDVVLDRIRKIPELEEPFKEVDATVSVAGGFDGLFGWWGDVAVAVAEGPDGSLGGGLLIQPTDAEAATRTFTTLRGFLALAGDSLGIELRDVPHGDATITVIDLSGVEGIDTSLPPGITPEIAYAVTDGVVVVGYDEAFVASVLDAGPGPSLADDERFKDLLGRTGEENIGLSFVDITAIRELVEPLAEDEAAADEWAFYEREIRPYVLPFDALVSGARIDGDLNRLTQVITVK